MITLSKVFHFFALQCFVVLLPQDCRNNLGLGYAPFARHY